MDITTIDGDALQALLESLADYRNAGSEVYRIRVATDEGGVKFKVNEGMWSPAYRGSLMLRNDS